MLGLLPNTHKTIQHRKIQSSLPALSLSELEKNYYALKEKKKQHMYSASNLPTQKVNDDLLIRSPFYNRTNCANKKGTCKCEYHKKQKVFLQQKFSYQKKLKIQSQLKLERLKTVQNSELDLKSIISHKRFNSLVNQTEADRQQNKKFKKQNNQDHYLEDLKNLQQYNIAQVDCYNYEYVEYLKQNNHWVLYEDKHKNTIIRGNEFDNNISNFDKNTKKFNNAENNDNTLFNKSSSFNNTENLRQKNRFRTVPYNFQDQDESESPDGQFKNSYLKRNADQKGSLRKKHKKFTQISRSSNRSSNRSINQQSRNSQSKFLSTLDSLIPEDRSKLESFYKHAFRQIGLNYPDLKENSEQNSKFFGTICRNLSDPDKGMVEQAKDVLKRMSKLPLNLYSTVLKQIKLEVQSREFASSVPNFKDVEESIKVAFDTIQNEVQEMVMNKEQSKGREKLSSLGNLRKRLSGRGSLFVFKQNESGRKSISRSSSFLDPKASKQLLDRKMSRFAAQRGLETLQKSQGNQKNRNSQDSQQQQTDKQDTRNSSIKLEQMLAKQKQKEVKKGLNLKKMKKNKNIMKMIDEEIEEENNKKILLSKKNNSQLDDQYLQERAASRRKVRDQEYRQHMDFLQKMKQRSKQRQQSITNEYDLKKNTVKVHYQRHKIFLKKMEMYLGNNSELKQMMINEEDNLFTKKRKLRILRKMLEQHSNQQFQSQFYREIVKYVEIYKKSCDLVVKKDVDKKYKKLSKKRLSQDCFFEEDFMAKQVPNYPLEMVNLLQFMKIEKELKFYTVKLVNTEEEENQPLMKDVFSYPTEKVNYPHRNRVSKISTKEKNIPKQKALDEKLIQVGLDNKSQKVCMQKIAHPEIQTIIINFEKDELESSEVRKLKERFDRNMQRYQKAFRSTNYFPQTQNTQLKQAL